jgi:hypothetical protein
MQELEGSPARTHRLARRRLFAAAPAARLAPWAGSASAEEPASGQTARKTLGVVLSIPASRCSTFSGRWRVGLRTRLPRDLHSPARASRSFVPEGHRRRRLLLRERAALGHHDGGALAENTSQIRIITSASNAQYVRNSFPICSFLSSEMLSSIARR